ncbi:MAG: D-alanine--D-alanine ligase [Clostridia bacterium]|nr:D-alanine--D-alanine ligase [Clostridia bacterium]
MQNIKENVVVVFGGKSTEHDISIITGLQAFANVDREKYNVFPIYIYRNGEMFMGDKLGKVETFANFNLNDKEIKKVMFKVGSNFLFISKNSKKEKFKPYIKVDCAVLCCHGMNGEDGTLQGVLELANIPYTSSGVTSSAISMDKIIMKDIFIANEIQTVKYYFFNRSDFLLKFNEVIEKIEDKLAYPIFIKPANLGSSIGISKCKNKEELEQAIDIAINYDSRILAEEGIENNVEVNCAVFGNTEYQTASKIEYPKSWSEFLSFNEKYTQRNKEESKKNNKIKEESQKLSKEIEEKIQKIAEKTFRVFNCSGVVRIDFLVDKKTNQIYLNELNSIPGSLAYYLFKEQGYSFKDFLNRLIDIAKKEKAKKNCNKFSYESQALVDFGNSNKMNK